MLSGFDVLGPKPTSLDLLLLRTGAEIANIIPINRITTRKINKVCIVGGHNGEVPRDIGRRIVEDGTFAKLLLL